VPSGQGISWWRRALVVGLVLVAIGAAPAAAEGGHLPGFSVADQRVAVAKLPESLRLIVAGFPGAKGTGLPHVGKGPVWFGEVQRPKRAIDVAGNGHWVCASETRLGGDIGGGGSSCTSPAAARELGLIDVGSCGKGLPRHFRVYGLAPDGVTAMRIKLFGGTGGRTVPVIENTFAFTIGRENFVLQATGDAAAEELERTLPLAKVAEEFGGDKQAGCSGYFFLEGNSKG
jgi:hypothetical protein